MINPFKLPIKYLTNSYIFEKDYPTSQDLLFDILKTNKKKIKIEKLDYNIENDKLESLLTSLEKDGYIKLTDDTITLLHTPFDE